jgi:hypothetical protein
MARPQMTILIIPARLAAEADLPALVVAAVVEFSTMSSS